VKTELSNTFKKEMGKTEYLSIKQDQVVGQNDNRRIFYKPYQSHLADPWKGIKVVSVMGCDQIQQTGPGKCYQDSGKGMHPGGTHKQIKDKAHG
jgi:hypothetical protein